LSSAGCYRCLQQALDLYEKQLTPSNRAAASTLQRAFDTAILVALREKELGIPFTASLERARALARRLPATPGVPDPSAVVELAAAAPGETSGMDPEAARVTPDQRATRKKLRPLLDEPTASGIVSTYLSLAIDCDDPATRKQLNADELVARHAGSTLIRYRLALCRLGPSGTFSSIRETDARWAETTYFDGRTAATSRAPNLRRGIDFLTQATAAFPESPAMLIALAHAERGYGDLEPALKSYDGVLGMVPTNREALLGRVITLSYLHRPADAIETATHMIDLGTWLLPDAYYWRAWNRYQLKALDEAWDDIERAVKMSANTNVFTLAGVIAFDRKELDTAKDRFQRARDMDQTNCLAHSYLALVHATQNAWAEATPIFSTAMTCFVGAAAQARRQLAALEASSDDPVYVGRLAADRRKTIEESDRKAAQAAYNAAQGFARAGQRGEALAHLQLVLEYPELKDAAETLKKLIER
jgi:tetratricopeptide (TPR) repeat protein